MSIQPVETTDLSIVADAAHAVNPWVALAYLAAGVLFILALRGLSSPATSRRGNRFGMIGMAIAVVTTLVTHVPYIGTFDSAPAYDTYMPDVETIGLILAAIALGAVIGLTTARRIAMTAMPQLVAAFHSLVGLAAVLVAAAAAGNPVAKWLGLVGVALASVNIFGGFAVTARMLAMYKKKER